MIGSRRPAATVPARLRRDLRPDEPVGAFVWARLPRKRTGYFTDASIAAVIKLVDLVRGWFAVRDVRERSVVFGFPLDRRMAMAVTDDRLVVWSASPRRLRSAVHRGDIPRNEIKTARLPYVGGVWRVVEIHLVDGRGVRFLVDRYGAEAFVHALCSTDPAGG